MGRSISVLDDEPFDFPDKDRIVIVDPGTFGLTKVIAYHSLDIGKGVGFENYLTSLFIVSLGGVIEVTWNILGG